MWKRFKNWLRAIIVEEVAKVSVSLTKERGDAIAALKNVEQELLRSFEAHMKALIEAEHEAFVACLRRTREHITNGEPNVWKASPETVAADHALKVVK